MSCVYERRPSVVVLELALVALALASCAPEALNWPAVGEEGWADYRNDAVGYSVRYPAVCTIDEEEDGAMVFFRYHGAPILVLRFTDESRARKRGLWPDHPPVAPIRLGGKAGQKYVYAHYDGPFALQTVSYVVAHRDRFLGLELRTGSPEPTAVQQTVLDSFSFG